MVLCGDYGEDSVDYIHEIRFALRFLDLPH